MHSMASADSSAMLRKTRFGIRSLSAARISLAVGKSLGIEASAVQNEREEMPDARVAVDHEAERGGAPAPGASA